MHRIWWIGVWETRGRRWLSSGSNSRRGMGLLMLHTNIRQMSGNGFRDESRNLSSSELWRGIGDTRRDNSRGRCANAWRSNGGRCKGCRRVCRLRQATSRWTNKIGSLWANGKSESFTVSCGLRSPRARMRWYRLIGFLQNCGNNDRGHRWLRRRCLCGRHFGLGSGSI